MKKQLLLTTALVVALSAPAMAEEQQGWFANMKQSVKTWFSGDKAAQAGTNAEVEAYLDEVTIAVPPMTGEEAAAIQPAAGDYIDDVETQMQTPAVAPGSSTYGQDESSFNTEFTGDQGSVAALGNDGSDLANIMPAAGDAEEITDESVVVAGETSLEATVDAEAATTDADMNANADTTVDTEAVEEMAAEAEATADEAQEAAEDMAHDTMNAIEETAPAAGANVEVHTDMETQTPAQ